MVALFHKAISLVMRVDVLFLVTLIHNIAMLLDRMPLTL